MIDAHLIAWLEGKKVRFCVIGGVALAVHGFARYTADVDLLTMEGAVLDPGFWSGTAAPEIQVGDSDDPLAGLVRWPGEPEHDLLVGRGYAMQLAVDTAASSSALGCPVATPLALVLLKLEAGGPQDRSDILSLAEAQRALGRVSWLAEIPRHVAHLSVEARTCWERVEPDLGKV